MLAKGVKVGKPSPAMAMAELIAKIPLPSSGGLTHTNNGCWYGLSTQALIAYLQFTRQVLISAMKGLNQNKNCHLFVMHDFCGYEHYPSKYHFHSATSLISRNYIKHNCVTISIVMAGCWLGGLGIVWGGWWWRTSKNTWSSSETLNYRDAILEKKSIIYNNSKYGFSNSGYRQHHPHFTAPYLILFPHASYTF